MNPLQQGLKPGYGVVTVDQEDRCNNESTTTRIETTVPIDFALVRNVAIMNPLQQGLKRSVLALNRSIAYRCNNESTTTRIETWQSLLC